MPALAVASKIENSDVLKSSGKPGERDPILCERRIAGRRMRRHDRFAKKLTAIGRAKNSAHTLRDARGSLR
jgi:hypothetical protein